MIKSVAPPSTQCSSLMVATSQRPWGAMTSTPLLDDSVPASTSKMNLYCSAVASKD
jgi:hypothetical protein